MSCSASAQVTTTNSRIQPARRLPSAHQRRASPLTLENYGRDLAALLARRWGPARADISPEEIAMAALLAEMGELLLWSFAPELPQAALAVLASGAVKRSVQAQEQACGFAFRQLTLKCATIWNLPLLLVQLIRGVDNVRANFSRLCVDAARHLASGPDDPALPSDLAAASQLVPGASLAWLAAQMPGLEGESAARAVAAAEAILAAGKP